MVLAGFHERGRTPLYRIVGNLTGIRYKDEILRGQIIPTLRALGQGAILQDDNSTHHRARVVRDEIQHQQINKMNWPARYPDLARIEHLWDNLGCRSINNHPLTVNAAQLYQFLLQGWMQIPQQVLLSHANSMRARIGEWLAACGHTSY